MFLKELIITNSSGMIREIEFHPGLNLIVDETVAGNDLATGNNVGKTTVLRLIDYCLGGKAKELYTDPENPKASYKLIEDFLIDTDVHVKLKMVNRLDGLLDKNLTIERNFLKHGKAIRKINGDQIASKHFDEVLGEELFPTLPIDGKPSFRQVIAHNIRADDWSIENTLHFLNPHTKKIEYEDLILYMLGCPRPDAGRKQAISEKVKNQRKFINDLRNGRSSKDYKSALDLICRKIEILDEQRKAIEEDSELKELLSEYDKTASEVSETALSLSEIDLRIAIVEDSLKELDEGALGIDAAAIKLIYKEANAYIPELQVGFEELLEYHRSMLSERMAFIKSELPALKEARYEIQEKYNQVKQSHDKLAKEVKEKTTTRNFEDLLVEVNKLYEEKGAIESLIKRLKEAEEALSQMEDALSQMEEDSKASGFEKRLEKQLGRFNECFSSVSERLYGESYVLSTDNKTTKDGIPYLDFHIFNACNMSSGKKQGEILCFDIAYTDFADTYNVDHLDFLLNDRKELMHGNQLAKLADIAKEYKVQIVLSILADKLPTDLNNDDYVVLRLSQDDKLFRI